MRAESAFSWLPSGGLMPGQDTSAIVDALWEGTGTPAGLITEITSLDGTVSYSYDSAGQLLAATYTTGQAAEVFSYDAAGNRITANGAAYITGPNNQLLFDGIYSYSYDPEGNRTARFIDVNANGLLDAGDTAATTYAWDHRNRLTRVTDYATYGDPATRAVDYLYDTENRWIGRDVDLDADGIIDTCTRFAYDGNQIALQFDRAATTGDPTDPLTLESLSHRYLWNPAAVDQLMADEQVTDPDVAGDIVWPLGDHQGTIRDLAVYDPATDTTTVVNHRTFDAYGNLQSQTSATVDCLFAYTGRPLDQETALQNNLHRWYDATTGRWMSEDPIGFEGQDGNLSAYVGNGPVNKADPSGLFVVVSSRKFSLAYHGPSASERFNPRMVYLRGEVKIIRGVGDGDYEKDSHYLGIILHRPEDEHTRERWTRIYHMLPREWRDSVTSWERWGGRGTEEHRGWLWPHLHMFLDGAKVGGGYGGWDPHKNIHNDYFAVVVREYDADGQETGRTAGDGASADVPGPLISTRWYPLQTGGGPVTNTARSEGFKITLGYTYKVWLVMGDMMDDRYPGSPWEGQAGCTIAFFEITATGRIIEKWPPPSTGYAWDTHPPQERL